MNQTNDSSNPQNDGSADEFFESLEASVNGAVADNQDVEVTQDSQAGPEQDFVPTTQATTQGPDNSGIDWEKRYKDSSREATKMRGELNNLKPFVPILDAMKSDSNLVTHVRDYLESGGSPSKTVTEKLGLDEDFVYDQDEALRDPQSDSAKVFNAHVDGLVQNRMNTAMQKQQKEAAINANRQAKQKEAAEFIKKHNMPREQFSAFMDSLKERKITLDDLYYLQNRGKTQQNVAKSVKEDMISQMKNVRDIPTSAGGINSPRAEKSMDDQIFETVNDSTIDFDDIFK
jgi:hypothetical protein